MMEHTNNNQILSEDERMRATDMFLRGNSREQIFSVFPNRERELDELLSEVSIMKTSADAPEKVLLQNMLSKLSTRADVTSSEPSRYPNREGSFISTLGNAMSNWKMGFAFAALVVLAGGGYALSGSRSGSNPQLAMKTEDSSARQMSLMSAESVSESDIDALFTEEAQEESTLLAEYDSDTALIMSDSVEMNDYKNTYDENQL